MGVIFCINLHLISCASPKGSFSSAEIFYFVFLTSHFLEPWSVALGEAGNFRLRMMNHQMRSACGRTASKTGRQIAISNVQQTYCNILQPIYVQRYYESKFDVGSDDIQFRYCIAAEYTLGLCWVLRYYYQGCCSWKWYFPYHYAPFASDFINIGDVKNEFELGTQPFKPLEQLRRGWRILHIWLPGLSRLANWVIHC